jgi:prophage maintenance system killer protein
MLILVSKTRAQGASVVTTLPAEVARRLSVAPGQELGWIEDGMGGFRMVPQTPQTGEALAVHEKIMAEYDAVFRALADRASICLVGFAQAQRLGDGNKKTRLARALVVLALDVLVLQVNGAELYASTMRAATNQSGDAEVTANFRMHLS